MICLQVVYWEQYHQLDHYLLVVVTKHTRTSDVIRLHTLYAHFTGKHRTPKGDRYCVYTQFKHLQKRLDGSKQPRNNIYHNVRKNHPAFHLRLDQPIYYVPKMVCPTLKSLNSIILDKLYTHIINNKTLNTKLNFKHFNWFDMNVKIQDVVIFFSICMIVINHTHIVHCERSQ